VATRTSTIEKPASVRLVSDLRDKLDFSNAVHQN
jgi:hypothetical protein